MKLKLSKRTRLILAVLLILVIIVYSLWGPDTAPPPADDALSSAGEAISEPLPEAESDPLWGAPTDDSNITGVPPNEAAADDGSAAPETDTDTGTGPDSVTGTDGPAHSAADSQADASDTSAAPALDENGSYTSREDVALYIHLYGHLPANFITKAEARELGWEGGSVEDYAPGMCIGGDRFGNYEGLLPEKNGRRYTECDIDTLGANSRGAKRIVFSNDGLIYYTQDHYESFELLYGEEDA